MRTNAIIKGLETSKTPAGASGNATLVAPIPILAFRHLSLDDIGMQDNEIRESDLQPLVINPDPDRDAHALSRPSRPTPYKTTVQPSEVKINTPNGPVSLAEIRVQTLIKHTQTPSSSSSSSLSAETTTFSRRRREYTPSSRAPKAKQADQVVKNDEPKTMRMD